ncbi:hypothetical protein LG315_03410 [Microbacterium marinum]|uniref:hypothetical protein n=1 Tax=Microbacterium marinum TaxID=421115 RepID=UPI003850CF00
MTSRTAAVDRLTRDLTLDLARLVCVHFVIVGATAIGAPRALVADAAVGAESPSAEWWWSRPVMFVAVLGVLLALSLLIARWEALGTLSTTPSRGVVAVAWLCAFLPPFAVMRWFLDLPTAVVGALLLTVAVVLLRHGARRTQPVSVRSEA